MATELTRTAFYYEPQGGGYVIKDDRHKRVHWTTSEAAAQRWIDEQQSATPAQVAPKPNAAQARRPARSHPLGDFVEAGDGYTVYEDTVFGGGRVVIYDES